MAELLQNILKTVVDCPWNARTTKFLTIFTPTKSMALDDIALLLNVLAEIDIYEFEFPQWIIENLEVQNSFLIINLRKHGVPDNYKKM